MDDATLGYHLQDELDSCQDILENYPFLFNLNPNKSHILYLKNKKWNKKVFDFEERIKKQDIQSLSFASLFCKPQPDYDNPLQ